MLASDLPQSSRCPTVNYELPAHIEGFLDIQLSLDLNQPLLNFSFRLFTARRAVRAPLAQIDVVINRPNLDGTPPKLGFDSNS